MFISHHPSVTTHCVLRSSYLYPAFPDVRYLWSHSHTNNSHYLPRLLSLPRLFKKLTKPNAGFISPQGMPHTWPFGKPLTQIDCHIENDCPIIALQLQIGTAGLSSFGVFSLRWKSPIALLIWMTCFSSVQRFAVTDYGFHSHICLSVVLASLLKCTSVHTSVNECITAQIF